MHRHPLSALLWKYPRTPHLAAAAMRALQLACLFAAAWGPLGAQGVTLDSALAAARARNADVRTAHARLDSARAEVRIARSFANPTVTVAPQSPYQYSLAAPMDVGPGRYYRVVGARAGASASEADGRDVLREIRFQVRQTFYDVLLTESVLDVARSEQGIFRSLLAADSARVRAGDAPERVLAKSEFEGSGLLLVDLLLKSNLCPSKGQARKDIEQGGININNVREASAARAVTSADLLFGQHLLLRKGKRNYTVVTVK